MANKKIGKKGTKEPASKRKKSESDSEVVEEENGPIQETKNMIEKLKGGEKVDQGYKDELIFAMLLTLHENSKSREIEEKIDRLDDRILDTERKYEKQELRLRELEVAVNEGKVIIKNLHLHKTAVDNEKKETTSQSEEVAIELLGYAGLTLSDITEFHRFHSKDKKTKGKYPNFLMKFTGKRALGIFMSKLKDVKDVKKLEEIEVEKYIPPSLRKEYLAASKEAYSLRKNKKMMTKTVVSTKGKIILLAKKKDSDEEFTERIFSIENEELDK